MKKTLLIACSLLMVVAGVCATDGINTVRPVFNAETVINLANLHMDDIEILSDGNGEVDDYIMDGEIIPALSYRHLINPQGGDSLLIVGFKQYPGLTIQYKNGSDKSNIFKVGSRFLQFDGKNAMIFLDGVHSGDTIVFVATAKSISAPTHFDHTYSSKCYLIPFQPEDETDPNYTDGDIYTAPTATTDNNYSGYTNLVYIVEDGDHNKVSIKETGNGARIAKILVNAYRGDKKRNYSISLSADANGSVSGNTKGYFQENISISATPNPGYYFTQWSDGNTDNPRTITVTQDTAFIAEFAPLIMVTSENSPMSIQNASAIWPIYMNDITYATNKDLVVSDFRDHLYIWDETYSSGNITGPNIRGTVDGYLSLVVGDRGWSGAGFNLGERQSKLAYTQLCHDIVKNPDDYYLHFAIKSTDSATHFIFAFNREEVHWKIGNDGYYDSFSQYESSGNFTRDGEWHEFNFPLAQFVTQISISANNPGESPNILCVLSGGVTGTQLDLDDIYIYRKSGNSTSTQTQQKGIVQGCGFYMPGQTVTLTAIPEDGYNFIQWQDGCTDNPRTFVATQDMVFTAEFSDHLICGSNLEWSYENGVLAIAGDGDMYDYKSGTAPWKKYQEEISSIVLPDGLTSIGDYAFYGLQNRALKKIIIPQTVTRIGTYAFAECNRLTSIHLPYGLESIGDYAFAGCTRINDITCLAPETPDTYEHTFEEVSRLAYLYVPCENKRAYLLDSHWKDFDIQCIGAEQEDTPVTDVIVVPEENNATITWPSSEDAETYTLVITKDGVVFCTLIFNSEGQLQGIAFAPARNGEKPARSALAVNGGWKFTVTGLDAGTQYDYTITTKNAAEQTLSTHTGSFTTAAVTTDVEDTTVNKYVNTMTKILRDGQLLILREGNAPATYNMQGAVVE